MSERIKRYISSGQLVSHSVGDICKYADVDAIEAENARLRRIVEAAEKMDYAIGQASGSMQIDAMVDDKGEFFGTTKVAFEAMKEAKAAYDAALTQPPSQVSAKVNSTEVDSNPQQQ